MQFMGLNNIREKYLAFFESKGHLRLPSFPLVPQNDNSLLLVNSGMAPLKAYFKGELTPPSKRVTTCQKCIRTPDIERVGKTARHGTFFEMLGNFSFGDYFKKEATVWAWEFVTKVMELPLDRLWISIYEKDDEAFEIWTKEVGVPADRIVRLGKADNFWEIGTGPCGPCSEIYFDRGAEYSCGSKDCAVGCDCDRYVEFWNLVFTQFDSDGKGNYTPLAKPNIDTGMGLERLACIMQGGNSLFEVDTIKNIIDDLAKLSGVKYGQNYNSDVSLRIIADHIRGTAFLVSDGVLPSNEGRGYVLRRLIRRAARHGRLLGIKGKFLNKLSERVINDNSIGYPELSEKKDYIQKVIAVEEEKFNDTVDAGLAILNNIIVDIQKKGLKVLSGDDVFKLYDTFGFPIDLTIEIAEEKGIKVDEESFKKLMNKQKEQARAARAGAGDLGWSDNFLIKLNITPTLFKGYEENECNAKVLGIINEGEATDNAGIGREAIIILSETPFYAESGGQVGDTGIIFNDDCDLKVHNCKKTNDGKFLHFATIISGEIKINDTVTAKIDIDRRQAIMRNHSSAHLLHKALREVLGNHIEQAGSYVDENRMRFDFTHFSALSKEEFEKVSDIVNSRILEGLQVDISEKSLKEAKAMGATALFGEKYGTIVRVVKMGDFSIELCGGTHIDNTSKIGLFKILSEASVASGVRRIEAVTGKNVLEHIKDNEEIINKAAESLKANNPSELAVKAESTVNELKALTKTVADLNQKLANFQTHSLLNDAETKGNFKIIAKRVEGANAETLRVMGDTIKEQLPDGVAVLAAVENGKISFVCVCGKEAVKNCADAGNIIKEVAKITGGGGGGRPDSATAGGKDVNMLDKALQKVYELV